MKLKNYIGGEFCAGEEVGVLEVPNPATGEQLAELPLSAASEAEKAVAAALSVAADWAVVPVVERARVMFRYRDLLERYKEDLAVLVTTENGKNLEDARGEVRRGIEVVEFACGMPTLMMGQTVPDVSRGIDSEVYRYPLGVVAGITPFNFPLMVPLWLYPIAIACGNTFILKPSERTPLSAVRQAELLAEAGLPAGVFNMVHGGKEVVDALLAHPDIQAISFVGSAPVAEYVYRTAAAHGKRVQALAGAKNHHIILRDAPLDRTIEILVASAYGNAGERCLAGSVAVVEEAIADELVSRLAAAARVLPMGSGLEPGKELGPVIRPEHRDRIVRFIEQGVAEGAVLVCDGRQAPLVQSPGFFLGATLFDHVRPEMTIAREEIFGPVLSVIRVQDLDEAIAIANLSRYGNAAVLYTQSGAAARKFRERIQAGMIGVNVGVPAPMAFYPFSGWKGSFYGDLHATGRDGVEFYTRKKVVTTRWFDS
ncbi:CoA-acylating methylmalonate-semialdehyde dehydrogenase [Alicyclobacillus shizuokensis]|uniref:CoA-acylating methylmalonate-semialdehyde dehydrogenase n=1 Tax=Alicyclobacillus shizuokensis TaxID=392014 RepID=UPI00082C5938|nr:CoA-acylating methylmalonate-semialdehyde dehydrogenase [Alicyclobacillus shizuokensis]MCL6627208.1 CoA-acylating methylmalonate-semialdehyde dehydrogenase [Alicyclobacillus shizuokensis]